MYLTVLSYEIHNIKSCIRFYRKCYYTLARLYHSLNILKPNVKDEKESKSHSTPNVFKITVKKKA